MERCYENIVRLLIFDEVWISILLRWLNKRKISNFPSKGKARKRKIVCMFTKKRKEEKTDINIYFELLTEFSRKVEKAGAAFEDLLKNFVEVEDKVASIKVLETDCDIMAHKILKQLNEPGENPFTRQDIFDITKYMDDIVDSLEECANRFLIFGIKDLRAEAVYMAEIILQAMGELRVLFEILPTYQESNKPEEQIIEINRLENEGDVIFRQALTKLFRDEKDPIELIKWKHILEELENCLDSCEVVANNVQGALMKKL